MHVWWIFLHKMNINVIFLYLLIYLCYICINSFTCCKKTLIVHQILDILMLLHFLSISTNIWFFLKYWYKCNKILIKRCVCVTKVSDFTSLLIANNIKNVLVVSLFFWCIFQIRIAHSVSDLISKHKQNDNTTNC